MARKTTKKPVVTPVKKSDAPPADDFLAEDTVDPEMADEMAADEDPQLSDAPDVPAAKPEALDGESDSKAVEDPAPEAEDSDADDESDESDVEVTEGTGEGVTLEQLESLAVPEKGDDSRGDIRKRPKIGDDEVLKPGFVRIFRSKAMWMDVPKSDEPRLARLRAIGWRNY